MRLASSTSPSERVDAIGPDRLTVSIDLDAAACQTGRMPK